MTKVFNLYEAKNQLSSLVDRAAAGEELSLPSMDSRWPGWFLFLEFRRAAASPQGR
jgi:hypothetical protein